MTFIASYGTISVMTMSISDFAAARKVTVQHARRLAREGKVPARRDGKRWEVVNADVPARTRRSLGAQVREDLGVFIRTRTMDHVTGMRKQRLANAVRQLRAAQNPASLLREYFAGHPVPSDIAGAALVKAAINGLDRAVDSSLAMRPTYVLRSPDEFAKRLVEHRLLLDLTSAEVAGSVSVPESTVRRVERGNYPQLGQVLAWKLARATDMPVSQMNISQEA